MFESQNKQKHIYSFFNKVFETKKLVRSYLLLGSNHADKEELAFALSQILNCEVNRRVWLDDLSENQNTLFAVEEAKYQDSCGKCQNCLWLEEKNHPKTPIFIDGSGAKNTIQVEAVRKLQEELSQSSEYFRVVVFKDATNQVLNKSSSAALLKTIEEARPNTMFLFFADAKEKVLATIVSRCQYLYFDAIDEDDSSDEALVLKEKISGFIADTHGELERLSFAEEIASEERDSLVQAFSALEKDYGLVQADLNHAKAIFLLEEIINDLRSFIKPKAAIKSFLDKFSKLGFVYEHA